MKTLHFVVCVCAALGYACGDDGGGSAPNQLPYATDTTTVIGGGGFDNPSQDGGSTSGSAGGPAPIAVGGVDFTTPDGSGCIDLDGECVKPQLECKDENAKADVLVDANGAVIDVICYPTGGVSVEDFEGPVQDVGNNAVLVLDDKDDGADVMGDVTVDGNNVTLWGNGPDTSVIDGNLHLDKNNALVRGIRITGDVVIDKNNPSIVDCVIEGNLLIQANNASVALCEVWGTTTITGNNAILVGNRLAGALDVTGQNTVCNDNRAFTDSNADGSIADGELGPVLGCTAKPDDSKPGK